MRYFFILFFLSLGNVLFGQEKNVIQILRYNRNEGIIFDFSNGHPA